MQSGERACVLSRLQHPALCSELALATGWVTLLPCPLVSSKLSAKSGAADGRDPDMADLVSKHGQCGVVRALGGAPTPVVECGGSRHGLLEVAAIWVGKVLA